MKKTIVFSILSIILSVGTAFSQITTFERNGWELSGGFGFDQFQKTFSQSNEIIKERGNYLNFSTAKYWKVIGLNASTRYTFNSTSSYLKTVTSQSVPNDFLVGLSESVTPLDRIDLAVGPMLRLPFIKDKLIFNIGAEGGMSLTNGAQLISESNINNVWNDKGFDMAFIPFARPKANLSFQMADQWALGFSGHYSKYFKDSDLEYRPLGINLATDTYTMDSWGFGVNITYILGKTTTTVPEKKKEPIVKNIKVKVVDKETEEPLRNSRVFLTNENGVVFRGLTDDNGEFTYEKLPQGKYTMYGLLNEVKTPVSDILPADFETSGENVEVTLLHFDPRFTLNGLTINKGSGNPEGLVYVVLKNGNTQKEELAISKKENGTFSFQLDPETDYSIFGRKDNFISEIEKVTTKGLERSKTLYTQLAIGLEEVELGKVINLENIYYDLDRAVIREDASKDLLKLVQFMVDNPKIRIELGSHTDSRGKDEYNYALSQARAQSVVNFLINRGISPGRLIAKGFGESKLVNRCADGVDCSEAEHQKNRRTEFMVIE